MNIYREKALILIADGCSLFRRELRDQFEEFLEPPVEVQVSSQHHRHQNNRFSQVIAPNRSLIRIEVTIPFPICQKYTFNFILSCKPFLSQRSLCFVYNKAQQNNNLQIYKSLQNYSSQT